MLVTTIEIFQIAINPPLARVNLRNGLFGETVVDSGYPLDLERNVDHGWCTGGYR